MRNQWKVALLSFVFFYFYFPDNDADVQEFEPDCRAPLQRFPVAALTPRSPVQGLHHPTVAREEFALLQYALLLLLLPLVRCFRPAFAAN